MVKIIRVTPCGVILGVATFFIVTVLLLHPHGGLLTKPGGSILGMPLPNHNILVEYERNLPQHNLDLPFPEGRTGRYVYFNLQPKSQGWNNVMNEWIIEAQIAHDAYRTYVFEDFAWPPISKLTLLLRPVLTPLWRQKIHPTTPVTALYAGPAAGGLWGDDDPAPRSVHKSYFAEVCPPHERKIINGRIMRDAVRGRSALDIFQYYVQALRDDETQCIEINIQKEEDVWSAQVFGFSALATERGITLMQQFLNMPASVLLRPSPLVASALMRNEYLFASNAKGEKSRKEDIQTLKEPYERIVAVHVRRGDFVWACEDHAKNARTYYGWMLWPDMLDKDPKPAGAGDGKASDTAMAGYMRQCYPTIPQLVSRLHQIRADAVANSSTPLDVLYLLTNGDTRWLTKLSHALKEDGWAKVVSTADLALDSEQTEVSMAVDMEIARRAKVFVGNGWSSMSSNVMHVRLRDGKSRLENRIL